MSKNDARGAMEQAIHLHADLSVHRVAAVEFIPSGIDLARIEQHVTPQLLADGAFGVLMERLDGKDRQWKESANRAGGLAMYSFVEPERDNTGYPEELIRIFAWRRTPTGKLGQFGLITTVGYRVRGSRFDVFPLVPDSASDLVWTANKFVGWAS